MGTKGAEARDAVKHSKMHMTATLHKTELSSPKC